MRGRVVVLCLVVWAVCAASAHAASPFAWRGVVEGAYERPWDDGQRTRMLGWLADHGFNAYVHAPKDDLYQRTRWRDPYPAGEQAEFDREIAFARGRGMDWIPNISPALPEIPTLAVPDGAPSRDLCFSCPADLDAVLAEFEPFRAAGARTFMVSFDDVVKVLDHPEDLAAYGAGDEGYGRANGDFLSRLYAALRARSPDARLLTVGADYQGTADTDYLRGLRATLRPEVQVMWTGTNVPSEDFPRQAALDYGTRIGRTPLVWDNWTNDDSSGNAVPDVGTARIFLGPYKRSADLRGAVGGFFFNPANEPDLNKLPLATAAEWLRDPTSYDPRAAFTRAVREEAGRRLAETLRAWAETSWSNKLDRTTEAPTFTARSQAFLDAYPHPLWPGAADALNAELGLVIAAPGRLGAALPDAQPFLASARDNATAGRLGVALLAAERPTLTLDGRRGTASPPDPSRSTDLRGRFQQALLAARANPRFTYGWRGGMAFDIPPYPVPRNTMDAFADQVTSLDAAWAPSAPSAASKVTVTLDGRPVPLHDGAFTLPPGACGLLVATDGAGGQTGMRNHGCDSHRA